MKNTYVQLRAEKWRVKNSKSFDSKGNQLDEIQYITLYWGCEDQFSEFTTNVKNLGKRGFSALEIDKVIVKEDGVSKDLKEIPEKVKFGFESIFKKPKSEMSLQEQLKALQDEILEMKKVSADEANEMEELTAKFINKFGRKPHHRWGLERLKEEYDKDVK